MMFGTSSSSSGGAAAAARKNYVEFRAGKMVLKGSKVTPDTRRGLLYIYKSEEDQLTHFCWKDRKSGVVEDDLILFPDDCEYKRCTQAKEGSRVYLLKFKSSSRRLFFWMQEPKLDKDEDYLTRVNEALNNPAAAASRGASSSGGLSATSSEQDMQSLLSSMTQAQLMQLIGGMSELGGSGSSGGLLAQLGQQLGVGAPSGGAPKAGAGAGAAPVGATAAAAAAAPAPPAASSGSSDGNKKDGAIKLDDLQKILSNIQPAASSAGSPVDLTTALSSDLIQRITSNPETVAKLAPLLPKFGGPETATATTPGEGTTSEDVTDTLTSPQFHSALRSFCTAFTSGQLGPLIAQFKFSPSAVTCAENGDLEGFIRAIQGGEDKKEKKDDDDMSVD